jgi:pyruvate dehydrogenase E2 component (dihydrolipoamide acetyltransferase)
VVIVSSAATQPAAQPQTKHPPADARRISPRARRVARELGVDCAMVEGSGSGGRIRERDVREAKEKMHPVAAAHEKKTADAPIAPLSSARKVIAERMMTGAHATAPVTLTTRADATNLVHLRDQFKISIAVDTEMGLLAPVLRDVQDLTVRQIATRSKSLIDLARSRRLTAEQMLGGTFTISNLGMFGIDAFTPIINVPQCAILGLGRIRKEPVVFQDQTVPRDMMTLSLTFDHRMVDGGPAARFLDTVRRNIEQPGPLLVS